MIPLLALQSAHETMWWIALGMGLVVIIAVIVLLSLLVSLVDDIDNNLKDTWETATSLAANTATTWMLQQSGNRTSELVDEVERHVALLSASGNGR